MTVPGHPFHQAAKPPDIHAQSRLRPQRHAGAVDREPLFADGLTEIVEAAAQRRTSLGLVQLRPEECGERVAAVGLIGGGQMCEQGKRLVAMERHRGACPLSAGWAEEEDVEGGHQKASHNGARIISQNNANGSSNCRCINFLRRFRDAKLLWCIREVPTHQEVIP